MSMRMWFTTLQCASFGSHFRQEPSMLLMIRIHQIATNILTNALRTVGTMSTALSSKGVHRQPCICRSACWGYEEETAR